MDMLFWRIIVSIMLLSCSKEEVFNADVESYIKQVKHGEYNANYLPEFSPQEIPILLNAANDFSTINTFPINPISSYAPTRFTVGECLLWTIEHIRMHYDSYNACNGFPSFIPELKDTTDFNSIKLDTAQLNEAYGLYRSWWGENKLRDFNDFRKINPLEKSKYRWK